MEMRWPLADHLHPRGISGSGPPYGRGDRGGGRRGGRDPGPPDGGGVAPRGPVYTAGNIINAAGTTFR